MNCDVIYLKRVNVIWDNFMSKGCVWNTGIWPDVGAIHIIGRYFYWILLSLEKVKSYD